MVSHFPHITGVKTNDKEGNKWMLAGFIKKNPSFHSKVPVQITVLLKEKELRNPA